MVSNTAAIRRRFFRVGRVVLLGSILLLAGAISAFTTMRLIIRSGEVQVPELVGKSSSQAKALLEETDLGLKILGERYDPAAASGAVLVQSPGAGTAIKEGRDVRVVVSLGPRRSVTPSLAGATLRAARLMAEERGYELGDIGYISSEASPDEIIAQTPEPNTKEVVNRKIDLLISNGSTSRTFVMPDLIGQEFNQAIAALERYNLKVGAVTYRLYENVAKGTVARQTPEAGYPVAGGAGVSLEVTK